MSSIAVLAKKRAKVVPASNPNTAEQRLWLESIDAESTFAFHLREITSLIASQQDQTRQMISDSIEKAQAVQLENQELRSQIANLRLELNPKKGARSRYNDLLGKHSHQTNKVLLKRDQLAREASAENAMLRETMAAMLGAQAPEGADQLPVIEDITEASMARPLSATSVATTLSGQDAERLRRAVERFDNVKASFEPTDNHVVSEMKMHGLPYESGEINFHDDSSDEESVVVAPPPGVRAAHRQTKVMDLKQRMRDMMTNKAEVADSYKEKGIAQRIARHWLFENFTMLVITFNAVWIGVDTVLNDKELLVDADIIFIVAENFFCVYYSFELVVRFAAFACKWRAFRDGWFIFDLLLLFLMIFETWVLFAIFTVTPDVNISADMSALRLLKLLRLSRIARMVKLMRLMPEVMVLIRGIGVASRSVAFTLCLLSMMIYVFAVAFTQLCKNTRPGKLFFNDLGTSMVNLFFLGCLGDGLGEIALSLNHENFLYLVLFLVFTILCPLTVMNMLVGVLVEVVRVVASFEQESMDTQYVTDQLTAAFLSLDADGDGRVSHDEFCMLMERQVAVQALADVGIDTLVLVDDPDLIFQGQEDLPFEEFVKEVMGLREANPATFKDVQLLRKHIVEDVGLLMNRRRAMEMKAQKEREQKDKAKKKHKLK